MPHIAPSESPLYPHTPGYRRPGTSKAAASAAAAQAPTLRAQVLALLKANALTADECAARLVKSILSIRPRLSELVALAKIDDSGLRRANASSGKQAIVWAAI